MEELIRKNFQDSIAVKQDTLKKNLPQIKQAAETLLKALSAGRKLFVFGNGGSAADSQHIAAELIGRFKKERRSLAAVALTTDTSILTSLGNDYSYDVVFARQLEGLGQSGDVALAISTSGNSKNVIEGIKKARALGMKVIGLTGNDGGKMAPLCDVAIVVPSKDTARIQESHMCVYHSICEIVENNCS